MRLYFCCRFTSLPKQKNVVSFTWKHSFSILLFCHRTKSQTFLDNRIRNMGDKNEIPLKTGDESINKRRIKTLVSYYCFLVHVSSYFWTICFSMVLSIPYLGVHFKRWKLSAQSKVCVSRKTLSVPGYDHSSAWCYSGRPGRCVPNQHSADIYRGHLEVRLKHCAFQFYCLNVSIVCLDFGHAHMLKNNHTS